MPLARLILCVLSAMACWAQRPQAKIPGPAFFVISLQGWPEVFTIEVDDPMKAQQIRDIISGVSPNGTITISLVLGPTCYNPPWGFHADPSNIYIGAGGTLDGDYSFHYIQQIVAESGELPKGIPVLALRHPTEELPAPGCVSLNPGASRVGVVRDGSTWTVDFNGNRQIDASDRIFALGLPGDVPITGDWNGAGVSKAGVYRNGTFILDYDGNGQLTGQYKVYPFTPPQPGDVPVIGKWHSLSSCIGIYRGGQWLLDWDCNGVFEPDKDRVYNFLAPEPGDVPVVGAWTLGTYVPGGNLFDERIGIYRKGLWLLDANGNGTFDGAAAGDFRFRFDGSPGLPSFASGRHPRGAADAGENDYGIPVVGDWNGDGRSKPGIFRQGVWALDVNGSHTLDFLVFQYGVRGDIPIVGRW